jgi:hypothetical protein
MLGASPPVSLHCDADDRQVFDSVLIAHMLVQAGDPLSKVG